MRSDRVKIFILDSEVEAEFLKSPALKIQPESSHGSQVAAIIRSLSRAEIRAFSAENIIKRIDKNEYLNSLNEIHNYARLHPEEKIVVNISLGFEESEFQKEIIEKISELENIVLIAAAGNNNRERLTYPAAFSEVTAVAALAEAQKMPGSNYGSQVDFSAPGVIEITQRDYLPALNYSRTYKISGTSFAAPQLTALLANILSLKPEISIEEGLKIIEGTAAQINDPLFAERKLGAGRINNFKALRQASRLYLWLQLSIYFSIISAALLFFYLCWQKYSLSGIFIFLISSAILYLFQPLLLLFYYQFGLLKIIIFLMSLVLLYYLLLKTISFFLSKSHNFALILKLAPYLNQNLQKQARAQLNRLLNQKNHEQTLKLEKMIKNHLRNCSSSKKCTIYLKLAALSNQLPIDLIIKKAVRFNLSSKLIAETLEKQENYKKQRLIISAELLKLIIEEAYSIKKKAAAVAADLAEPLALVPLKNLLLKRNELRLSSEAQYFLLDLLASFGSEAADLAELLKNIISKSSDPWLKYHALKAYTQIAVKNESYQEFIAEMKAKEKEPVTLALE
ncbi:MAG: peptidase S8 and S53 subtilisin kexin sedolisin [Halanaerobium sp.]|uniref:Subtilase family protein n=1 Tax=Halanaerobium saccharolyticum TaxID=43595 RepID=A0A4R6S3A1_9FIRM|nr:S8/S53 family peptidase [Halanaerobium saccharolyticum]PUU93910.1 MAG: peptidase S8 and S53 subtilisin kexin sedolisin [Halanaerobium sp.]TDP93557.1 subtilase family protein [Halanaerobium saccharolyticum]